jgi:hypothetical protein
MPEASLRQLAKVVRSKNSGPFEITFDVIFDRKDVYERVRDSDVLQAGRLAQIYGVGVNDVITCMFFEPALAFKLTLRRTWGQGTTGERDTFGAQQHAPLLDIRIP